ncbi:hypothetical protein P5673_026492 [Acropora cervicornis]|uniref:RNA-directed DNA polymerase from mobile element jockey n=1 Tax=Acropora cervicornis TaxID=6130 RepID=A0AAD9UWR6_ACRCE|nr:hypothetical protein P5673_026492 [Acropora cervicornis]
MSLAPKIDELRHVIHNANLDFIGITESWLWSHIHDNVVALERFNIIHRDRVDSEHGGVCMYIKDLINFKVLVDLQDPSFEMLWAKLNPARLPRGCNSFVVGTLYHPRSASDPADFNKRPPFGLSDHTSIELQPKKKAHVKQPTITIKGRDLRPSKRQAMGNYLDAVNVCTMTCTLETCAEKVSLLELIITTGFDHILPIQSRKVHSTEPPWITSSLKELIQARQHTLSCGDNQQFRELRNRVNREQKACRAKYFQVKVEHLKKCKPSAWWKEIKKLSGCSPASSERSYVMKSLQHLFTPLHADYVILPTNSTTQQPVLVVSNESVYSKLMKLNTSKAHGPDGIPGCLLKENADLLAVPIADILNSSYCQGHLPPSWKEADLVPLPKQRPVQDINKHLRPISLTPILSKIAQEYVVDT